MSEYDEQSYGVVFAGPAEEVEVDLVVADRLDCGDVEFRAGLVVDVEVLPWEG